MMQAFRRDCRSGYECCHRHRHTLSSTAGATEPFVVFLVSEVRGTYVREWVRGRG